MIYWLIHLLGGYTPDEYQALLRENVELKTKVRELEAALDELRTIQVTINQKKNQTIHVRTGKDDHTESFRAAPNTKYVVTAEAAPGFIPGDITITKE